MAAREKVFNIRFTGGEWDRVQALAERYGLSAASLFRLLLKAEERRASDDSRPDPRPVAVQLAETSRQHTEAEADAAEAKGGRTAKASAKPKAGAYSVRERSSHRC